MQEAWVNNEEEGERVRKSDARGGAGACRAHRGCCYQTGAYPVFQSPAFRSLGHQPRVSPCCSVTPPCCLATRCLASRCLASRYLASCCRNGRCHCLAVAWVQSASRRLLRLPTGCTRLARLCLLRCLHQFLAILGTRLLNNTRCLYCLPTTGVRTGPICGP